MKAREYLATIIGLAVCFAVVGITSALAGCPVQQQQVAPAGKIKNDDNCVYYVRDNKGVKRLPSGLTTYQGKLRIINTKTPRKGDVAIIKINSGSFANIGHVAYVTDAKTQGKKAHLAIEEAHYPRRGIWTRAVTCDSLNSCGKSLNIVGYYRP